MCSVCFTQADVRVKCSRFNCDWYICNECLNSLVEFCYENYKTMPCCVGERCDGEFLYNQIAFVLSDSNMVKYNEMCRKKLDEIAESSRKTRDEKKMMRLATKKIMAAFASEA